MLYTIAIMKYWTMAWYKLCAIQRGVVKRRQLFLENTVSEAELEVFWGVQKLIFVQCSAVWNSLYNGTGLYNEAVYNVRERYLKYMRKCSMVRKLLIGRPDITHIHLDQNRGRSPKLLSGAICYQINVWYYKDHTISRISQSLHGHYGNLLSNVLWMKHGWSICPLYEDTFLANLGKCCVILWDILYIRWSDCILRTRLQRFIINTSVRAHV